MMDPLPAWFGAPLVAPDLRLVVGRVLLEAPLVCVYLYRTSIPGTYYLSWYLPTRVLRHPMNILVRLSRPLAERAQACPEAWHEVVRRAPEPYVLLRSHASMAPRAYFLTARDQLPAEVWL